MEEIGSLTKMSLKKRFVIIVVIQKYVTVRILKVVFWNTNFASKPIEAAACSIFVNGNNKYSSDMKKKIETILDEARYNGLPTHIVADQLLDLFSVSNCADLKHELEVTDKLLEERQRVLDAIPECPSHGKCVPHAIEWIEEMKAKHCC